MFQTDTGEFPFLDPILSVYGIHTSGVSMGNRQLLRRPRPNPLKLSGFVENFVLIILVIIFFKFDSIFTKIQVKYYKLVFLFCKK